MKKLYAFIKRKRLFLFTYIPFAFVFFLFIFLLMRYPEVSSEGVKKGIEICLEMLIPSLYPFMVLSGTLVFSGVLMKNNRLLSFVSHKVFSLDFYALSVFVLSCLGGYPVGAISVEKLYKKGSMSKNEGKKLLSFSVNPSPAFVISSVGFHMLGSIRTGVIMYVSILLSSVITGAVLSRITSEEKNEDKILVGTSDKDIWSSFVLSVKSSALSMGIICGFVVFFSAVFSLASILPFDGNVKLFLKCIIEISGGISSAASVYSLPMLTFFLSFGGICSLLQVLTYVSEMGIKLKDIILLRLAGASLSFAICALLLKIFPVAAQTFSSGDLPETASFSYSASVSVGMIIMTFLFIIGDSFVIEKKVDINKR